MNYKRVAITHMKADFDAIASAWGAYRLHSCEAILIATECEPNVHEYLKTVNTSHIHKLKIKEIGTVENLDFVAVTDCKMYKRLGQLAPITAKTEELAIYDHHITFGKDLSGTEEHIGATGSCTTLVVERLLNSEVAITASEATLYLLGIYEDTGLLTFSSTTTDDLFAVARLIELGGDVTVVNDYIKRELSRTQIFILNELLINMSVIRVGGVDITYSYASIDEYIEELAFLTHRMMEMEGIGSLIILVRMGPRIVLVARSKEPNLDVSRIAARFGGGGHPQAASANIKDLELHEALEILKVAVRELVRPVRFVREIMSSPARTLDVNSTITDAWNFTLKHNLNNIPVVKGYRQKKPFGCVGIISRKDILQGIKHDLAKEKVSTLMQTEFQSVDPGTPFRMAEDIMLSTSQKLVPVVDAGGEDAVILGVISRTDLLRLMHEESAGRSAYEEGTKTKLGLSRTRNITNILRSKLPKDIFDELRNIGEIAAGEGLSAYLVGGIVRDLIMGHPSKDLDIVVEGDAPTAARLYAEKVGGTIAVHEKYRTATVCLPSGAKFDFASARTEFYTNPGASPSVEASSLRNDLARRDFTINAMAVSIDSDFGQLVDYFGGQRDILDKKIRVLHSLSIIDDPSRAFRAIRFAARYGFTLGTNTERLIKDAARLGLYNKITPQRLFTELQYILMESDYLRAIALLKKYEMLEIADNINFGETKQEQFRKLEELYSTRLFDKSIIWHIRFVLLFYENQQFKALLEKFSMPQALSNRLLGIYYKARYTAKGIKETAKPSEIYKLLFQLTNEALLLLGVILGEKNDKLLNYLKIYRYVKPVLKGRELKKLGLPESAVMGGVIEKLLLLRLDGEINSKEDEEAYVKKVIRGL